jgi:hypothetical protein
MPDERLSGPDDRYSLGSVVPDAFDYVTWLENTELQTDDQDHEWCAVFVVIADSAELAAGWPTRSACSSCTDSQRC